MGSDGPLYCLDQEAEDRLSIGPEMEDKVTDIVGAAIDDFKSLLNSEPEPVAS